MRALAVCGIDPDDPEEVYRLNYQLDIAPWFSLLPEYSFGCESSPEFKIRVSPDMLQHTLDWRIANDKGEIARGSLGIEQTTESGEYGFNGTRFSERVIPTGHLPCGYYQLSVTVAGQSDSGVLPGG